MSNPEIKKKIIDLLTKEFPKDFSIKEIKEELGFSRGTISKYLEVLKAEKRIFIPRNFGKINLYSVIKRKEK